MKNLKVSMKLIVSFLVVIALAIVVGALGIIGMYRINEADDAMYEGNYLPTVLADEISQNIVEQQVYIREFVIYDVDGDAELFKNTVNDIDASKKEMEELFVEYDATIVNPDDRAAFDEFLQVYRNEWAPFLDGMYSLGAANKTEEAKAALTSGSAIAGKMDELSDILQEVNLADGKKAVDGNTDLFNTMTLLEVIALVLAVAVAMFFAFYVSSLISKPMTAMRDLMEQMGTKGDLNIPPDLFALLEKYRVNKDEIGASIGACKSLVGHITHVAEELQVIASGDLTGDIAKLSSEDTLGNSLAKMQDNLNNMFQEINSSTNQVSTGSSQIADGAQMLAQGATEQSATVEELSASITEISEKTKQNAGMAGDAKSLGDSIKESAERGTQQMEQMMQAVKEINEASQSIGKVIKIIDDIAFQTNILALNAAVEAARAGQHGKGFAVVADEVRNLAAKSAAAAKNTSELIESSIKKAELGASISEETAASLNQIVEGIMRSSQLVGDIAESSNEQAVGIGQISEGIGQVSQVIQQNSATAEESAAASEEMSGQAAILQQLVAQFKLRGVSSSPMSFNETDNRHSMPARAPGVETGYSLEHSKY